MWLFAMFDLPVDTPEGKRNYVRFRRTLLQNGFLMMQFSVYARYFGSEEASKVHRKRVRQAIPSGGHVRLLAVTDHQFGKMDVFHGKRRESPEEPPPQMMLF